MTGYLESTSTPQQLKAASPLNKGKTVAGFNYEQLYENELDKKHKDQYVEFIDDFTLSDLLDRQSKS